VKVAATGSYAPARQQFFVRGKQQDGHAGYWVLAPLLTGRSAVLVVRGWVRHPSDPAASSVPTGPVRVIGWLQPPEPASTPYGPASDSRVVTAVSTASLVAQVPYDLYSGYLVVAEQRPPERQLDLVERPVAPGSGTAGWRNLAYAGQWWLFAAFVAFMWWRIVRDARVA
jgi:cytochrome oxidase assembly protein ShyY1